MRRRSSEIRTSSRARRTARYFAIPTPNAPPRPKPGERPARLGLPAGAAVASIAWNNHRHLEAYYAVSGSGMVIHTCNPRLHPDQLIYIINHAEDRACFFDALSRR